MGNGLLMVWFHTSIQVPVATTGKCLFDQYCSQTFASQTIIINMLFLKIFKNYFYFLMESKDFID
jgi:hypothetical protein